MSGRKEGISDCLADKRALIGDVYEVVTNGLVFQMSFRLYNES